MKSGSPGRSTVVVTAQAFQLAPVALGGASFSIVRRRRGDPQLVREALPRRFSGRVFFVERRGLRRRPTPLAQDPDGEQNEVRSATEANAIACMKSLGWFGAEVVDLDLAARDGLGGCRARLEEAGGD